MSKLINFVQFYPTSIRHMLIESTIVISSTKQFSLKNFKNLKSIDLKQVDHPFEVDCDNLSTDSVYTVHTICTTVPLQSAPSVSGQPSISARAVPPQSAPSITSIRTVPSVRYHRSVAQRLGCISSHQHNYRALST